MADAWAELPDKVKEDAAKLVERFANVPQEELQALLSQTVGEMFAKAKHEGRWHATYNAAMTYEDGGQSVDDLHAICVKRADRAHGPLVKPSE